MSDRLTNFLVSLATDPERQQQYERDPEGTLQAAGLSAEEQAAVRSQDAAAVRGAIGGGPADHLTQLAASRQGRRRSAKKGGAAKKRAAKKTGAKRKTAKKAGGRRSGSAKGAGGRKSSSRSGARKKR